MPEFGAIVENAEGAIISISLPGIIQSWNKSAERILELSAKTAIGKSIFDLKNVLTPLEANNILELIKKGERIDAFEFVYSSKTRGQLSLVMTVFPIRDKSNHIIEGCIIIHDSTQQKLRERELAIQYRVALALSESPSFNLAANSILKTISEILGYQVSEIWFLNQKQNQLEFFSSWISKETYRSLEEVSHDMNFKFGEGLAGYIWETNKPYWVADISSEPKIKRRNLFAEHNLKSSFGFPIRFQNEVMGVFLFFSEHIEKPDFNFMAIFSSIGTLIATYIKRKQIEEDLIYVSQHDPLTGLINKETLEDNLNGMVVNAKLNNSLAAVLDVDLDNFKKINDSIGHEKGDLLLQQVAKRIVQNVRQVDIVARFGGDEFIILLPTVKSTKTMARIAQKILESISKPFLIDNNEFFVTASVGISIFPDNGPDAQALLKNADLALHYAKGLGFSSYQFCLPNMAVLAQQKIALENELHAALDHHEFILYYQPKVNIRSGAIVGVEALIRWPHDHIEIMPPSQFLPLAEEANLIIPINEWVLEASLMQMKSWKKKGLPEHFRLSVNVSAKQISPHFVELIKRLLQQTGLSPAVLELEFTENSLMQVTEENYHVLHMLKELGINLEIDDFGTGYSSFSYLINFGIDTVKIDRSFMSGLPDSPNAKAIILAIITMAHSLNMTTIAEGVETQAQLIQLAEMRCDEYQGYYFSRPLPPDEVYAMIKKK